MEEKKSKEETPDMPVAFKQTLVCPLCGELHEFSWTYKGIPMLACPKMEEHKIYFTNTEK